MNEKKLALIAVLMVLIGACGYKAPPPGKPELQGPSIKLISPIHGNTLSDSVEVSLEVSDPSGVKMVMLFLDGEELARDSVQPFMFKFDSSQFFDGEHKLFVKAADRWDNWSTSDTLVLFFKNGKVRKHENKGATGR